MACIVVNELSVDSIMVVSYMHLGDSIKRLKYI